MVTQFPMIISEHITIQNKKRGSIKLPLFINQMPI